MEGEAAQAPGKLVGRKMLTRKRKSGSASNEMKSTYGGSSSFKMPVKLLSLVATWYSPRRRPLDANAGASFLASHSKTILEYALINASQRPCSTQSRIKSYIPF